ncbi:MAG TPA: hypothetical protein GXX55_03110 [Firmicutes bacterium]|nr:hypothetical protein [Bacillota bacterium]
MSNVATTEAWIRNSWPGLGEDRYKLHPIRLRSLHGHPTTGENIYWHQEETGPTTMCSVLTTRASVEITSKGPVLWWDELVDIGELYEFEDRQEVLQYLAARPYLVEQLRRLPERVESLWGQDTHRTFRLSLVVDPEEGGQRLVVQFEGTGDPERDSYLLEKLDAERAASGEAVEDGLVVLAS